MKKIYFLSISLVVMLVVFNLKVNAQTGGVAINAAGTLPDSSAVLDVNSSSKGQLMLRMNTAQRDAINKPAEGLTIFNTDCHVYNFNAGTPSSPNWSTLNSSNALVAGVSISANPIGAICAGSTVTFNATPSQNNLSPSYQWKVNGNNMGTNSAIFTDSTLHNGDVVNCILTSSVSCVTGSPATSNGLIMLVNIVPEITGTTPSAFCSGSAVTLSASANLGTINWYDAPTGGSSLSSGASFTVAGLNSNTTYYVDASANGCTTPTRTAVTATYYPMAAGQPGAITGPTNDSLNSSAIYSIGPLPNVANYQWTAFLGIITSGQGTDSVHITWDSSGFGSLSVSANNPCGVSAAQTEVINIQAQLFTATGNGYTGSIQTFTAPVTATYTVKAYGAQGGNSATLGGYGAFVQGDFNLTQGQQLSILVGQAGANPPDQGSGGGGGGTFVVYAGNPLIIAGGGGGGGDLVAGGPGLTTVNAGNSSGGNTSTGGTANNGGNSGTGGYYAGGGGGGGTCCNGQDGNYGGGLGGGGGAGFTGNGGAGQNSPVAALSYVNGGNGGYQVSYGNSNNSYGGFGGGGNGVSYSYQSGGGGGGYTGGGGGSGSGIGGGGGGGGSYNSGANQNSQQGAQTGNGQVIISWN